MKKYKKMNYGKVIDVSVRNILLGSGSKGYKGKYPTKDSDFDRILNFADCAPHNRKKHGILKSLIGSNPVSTFLANTFGNAQNTPTITKISAPTITGGKATGGVITGGKTDVYTPSHITSYSGSGSGAGAYQSFEPAYAPGSLASGSYPAQQYIEQKKVQANPVSSSNANLGTGSAFLASMGSLNQGSSNFGNVQRKTTTDLPKNVLENQRQNIMNELQIKGYTPYQAKVLANEGYKALNYSKEESQKAIVKYEKSQPGGTLLAYWFGGAGETKQEADYQKQLKEFERNTSYGTLFKTGQLPSVVRKGAYDLGGLYFGTIAKGVSKVSGKPEPSKQSQEPFKDFWGNMFLWGGFSPAFKTGASYADEFQALSPKKKTGQQLVNPLGENKFGNDMDQLDLTNRIFNKVSKDLLEKGSSLEQTKYLNNLAKNLKTKADKDAFKGLVQELYNKGFYKGIPLNFPKTNAGITARTTLNTGTNKGFSYSFSNVQLPTLKRIGTIAGAVTNNYGGKIGTSNKDSKSNSLTNSNDFMSIMLGARTTGGANVFTGTKNKERGRIIQTGGSSVIDILIGRQPQPSKLGTPQLQPPRTLQPPKYPKTLPPFFYFQRKPKPSYSYQKPTYSTRNRIRKGKYTASVASVQLNIYAPKNIKTKNYVSSGIGLRGMLLPNYAKNLNRLLGGTPIKRTTKRSKKTAKKQRTSRGQSNYSKNYLKNLNKIFGG